jgi:hypothetical protein
MPKLRSHIKDVSKIILIMVLIVWQLFSLSLFTLYGVNELNKRDNYTTVKSINDIPHDTLLIKKDVKEIQILFPYLEKQKYKHVSKYNIFNDELLLLVCYSEKQVFHFQEVQNRHLNPRSPPHNLT